MYQVEILEHAFDDLEKISKYIFEESFSRELSRKVHDEIIASIMTLKIFPLAFPIVEWKYRVMIVKKKYNIIYKIDEAKRFVEVGYILRSSENSFIH